MHTLDITRQIGRKLEASAPAIAEEIETNFQEDHHIHYRKLSRSRIQDHIQSLVMRFARGMQSEEDTGMKETEEWGTAFGAEAAELQLSAEKAMLVLPALRQTIYGYIREEFLQQHGTMEAYFAVADTLNPMIDRAIYAFTQSYVEHNAKKFQEAQDKILELSVPVVPVTQDVAILPIVGSVDSSRSHQLLEQALEQSRERELSTMILDLSGVHMIDTYVAQHLFQLNDALKIIGIQVMFSGLRPELAQTMVHLGISFDQITVVSSLPQALKKIGLQVDTQTK
ncbi:STAS domain-containing protein [Alkalicoccus chagannorensis]|uniref:STAS domain-containing protein n=1 Tax=Alkalicoccus chagannorensis TaxID=427072 RepID=UPI0003F51C58|nr:STAS domain-containing protein [Alkalicoccus chagannorensis]